MFLFGDMRRKKEIDSPIIFEYKPIKCKKCDEEIGPGQPIVHEGWCWDCFKKVTLRLMDGTVSMEDSSIVIHLLDIARIYYKGPDGRL